MSMDYKLIGARIQKKRKLLKKTQENMAEALLVTPGYISQIERGITRVNLETLSQIAEYLSCDVEYLITGVTPSKASYLNDELMEACSTLTDRQKKLILDMIASLKKNGIT